MANKKVFEILELLKDFVSGKEIIIEDYALQTGISTRTARRYVKDLREIFGEEFIAKLAKGSYICKNTEFFKTFISPNKYQNESEKLIDLLHIINPGFSKFLPQAHKKVDEKLEKELSEIFLIKGSPHEKTPNLDIFAKLQQAIKFKKYTNLKYDNEILKNVKILKLIYSKGNWSVATLRECDKNSGFEVLRVNFIDEIRLLKNTFYTDKYTENFIQNLETFFDGYRAEPFVVRVAISPKVVKFFEKKTFFASQKITDEILENLWRVVEFTISSDDMLMPLARRWFPDFVILSPKSTRDKFDKLIMDYLKFGKNLDRLNLQI
ncbi:helix-turn-helix domain-containing protein [Campylobacter sp. JMF_04 NA10]|uniref:helix-turn-helix transcriptional regulator n=1 Tax=Campylobacter sp. JMF_04 NA10 TaxID=2983824 RepID=UPI0022E9B2C0|nr:WYL domain-containing transcriptional regulator [Campylobacter sp. JMF_04 NA10]MDA3075763.1 helix-turn-helix domain-containing protein [Campylobacter sp. JMF_04 NA10]